MTTETTTNRLTTPDQVLDRVRQVFGADRAELHGDDQFRIGSESTRVVALPQTAGEVAEMLRLAGTESWRVIPAGAGTWLEMGNQPPGFELIISTRRLDRLLEYEPADLTATVEAGLPLASFNQTARAHGQWIPLDPFGSPDGTIGAMISTASHGPLRGGFGTPRDWLIGIQVATIDGRLTRAGGKVVKNVAGYDLGKLYTGSYGTLAIITEMTFKLRSIPPAGKTLVFTAAEAGADGLVELAKLAGRIQQSSTRTASPITPVAMELVNADPADAWPFATGRAALVIRLLHEVEAVESQVAAALALGRELRGIEPEIPAATVADSFWSNYHASETAPHWGTSLRLSFLPAELPEIVADVAREFPTAHLRAHAANGVLRVHFNGGSEPAPSTLLKLRETLRTRGGRLVILRAGAELRQAVEIWGEVGETQRLMRAIKQQYDPDGRLNPGRFVEQI
jgi:glycolate oxidase FAD binding subunit